MREKTGVAVIVVTTTIINTIDIITVTTGRTVPAAAPGMWGLIGGAWGVAPSGRGRGHCGAARGRVKRDAPRCP